jgi:hypothetical protein
MGGEEVRTKYEKYPSSTRPVRVVVEEGVAWVII